MRFMKHYSLFLILMVVLMLYSCAKVENSLNIEISPMDKSLVDLSTKIYSETELFELEKFNGSLSKLNDKYPVECLREDNGIYRASYLGDESIVIFLFDASGNKIRACTYSAKLSKSDFDELDKGSLLDEVREIDPNGEYLFLYTGRNDTPKMSSHYTKDGYLIIIEYNDSNEIINISKEPV